MFLAVNFGVTALRLSADPRAVEAGAGMLPRSSSHLVWPRNDASGVKGRNAHSGAQLVNAPGMNAATRDFLAGSVSGQTRSGLTRPGSVTLGGWECRREDREQNHEQPDADGNDRKTTMVPSQAASAENDAAAGQDRGESQP